MAAPALVLLANGTTDPRVASTMHSLRKRLQSVRPDLAINVAFVEHCPPTGPQVVSALANRGATEVVLVPLALTSAIEHQGVEQVAAKIRATHPNVRVGVARPIGPAVELLTLLDERLRDALRSQAATQLDALVLAAPERGDARGSSLLQRRARQWSAHHKLPCVVATNDQTGGGTAAAVAGLRAQGRRHIAVGSLWIAPDQDYLTQAKIATARGAIAVAEPLGDDDRVLELAVARYAFAAMALLPESTGEAAESSVAL